LMGATPFHLKKSPPTLSSKALLGKKNQQKCPKKGKNCEKPAKSR
jgi:hypothetical protein